MDLSDECCKKNILVFSKKVEVAGIWPANASTASFFLLPRGVTSDRSTAFLPALILWWECLRGFRSVGLEKALNITCYASSKFDGGAERTGCESLIVRFHVRYAK